MEKVSHWVIIIIYACLYKKIIYQAPCRKLKKNVVWNPIYNHLVQYGLKYNKINHTEGKKKADIDNS